MVRLHIQLWGQESPCEPNGLEKIQTANNSSIPQPRTSNVTTPNLLKVPLVIGGYTSGRPSHLAMVVPLGPTISYPGKPICTSCLLQPGVPQSSIYPRYSKGTDIVPSTGSGAPTLQTQWFFCPLLKNASVKPFPSSDEYRIYHEPYNSEPKNKKSVPVISFSKEVSPSFHSKPSGPPRRVRDVAKAKSVGSFPTAHIYRSSMRRVPGPCPSIDEPAFRSAPPMNDTTVLYGGPPCIWWLYYIYIHTTTVYYLLRTFDGPRAA